MKTKSVKKGISVVIAVIIIIFLLTIIRLPKSLGGINCSYSKQTTLTSDISFLGEAGDNIKFSFSSHIGSGNLDIILYDSKGNAVYKLDKAKELETFFTLDKSDTYTLAAECNNFIGKYKIKVYRV